MHGHRGWGRGIRLLHMHGGQRVCEGARTECHEDLETVSPACPSSAAPLKVYQRTHPSLSSEGSHVTRHAKVRRAHTPGQGSPLPKSTRLLTMTLSTAANHILHRKATCQSHLPIVSAQFYRKKTAWSNILKLSIYWEVWPQRSKGGQGRKAEREGERRWIGRRVFKNKMHQM